MDTTSTKKFLLSHEEDEICKETSTTINTTTTTNTNKHCYTLDREKHIAKLKDGLLEPLPRVFQQASPAQTWIVYWICHPLSLFAQDEFLATVTPNTIKFLSETQHPLGGFSGGKGHIAHMATTYAAVNALITLCSEEALELVDRARLIRYLHRMKQSDGSFKLHDDGEVDSRAVYCALSVMRCLNITDEILLKNTKEWILSCQTYEGGFGSVPGAEAHGGYTFCCVSGLYLLDKLDEANILNLLRWLVNKQMVYEGGFCGRSNKLVDSCYSFWQGAIFPIIQPFLSNLYGPNDDKNLSGVADSQWLFDCEALQEYILGQCQAKTGLLRDKPGAKADFYHTCYALSGLSISQNQPTKSNEPNLDDCSNLRKIHPVFGLTLESLSFCKCYFKNKNITITLAGDKSRARA